MVAVPHWADQPTISKYMDSVWALGVKVRKDENGLVTRDEVERCIKDVMDGDRKDEYRMNATVWMKKAKEAAQYGGSSDKNIVELVMCPCVATAYKLFDTKLVYNNYMKTINIYINNYKLIYWHEH
jgi:hypothetical protein